MGTLYKSQWVTQEAPPSGHIRLHSGLMAQSALGRTLLSEEKKNTPGPGKWGAAISGPQGCRSGLTPSACSVSGSKNLAAWAAAEGASAP